MFRSLLLIAAVGCVVEAPPAPVDTAPACAGTPALEVGTGDGAFIPLGEGDALRIEAGAQGGFHVPAALRLCAVEAETIDLDVGVRDVETGLVFSDTHFLRTPRQDDACCDLVDAIPAYLTVPESLVETTSDPAAWLDGRLIELSLGISAPVALSGAVVVEAQAP